MTVHSISDKPSLGVYMQVPFCASKCTFCNFSSSVERSTIFDQYTRMLERELADYLNLDSLCGISPNFISLPVDSIYMGGGTPALLGEERLRHVAHSLQDHLQLGAEVEFTLETTPGSASVSLLQALRAMGINRLSIGAQTFDEQELSAVGRLHTVPDTSDLVCQARQSGFPNISLDLIAGLPHQTEKSFRRSLETAVRLGPEHISLYLFEVDEKSRLGKEVVHGGNRYQAGAVPGDDFMADAYESACAFFASEGYNQYEISNFALPGHESRHNRKYWQLAPYLGLGAGAHSFDGTRRWSNQSNVQNYLAKLDVRQSCIEESHMLTTDEQVEEFFFLGLRQVEGVNMQLASERWGAEYLTRWTEKIQRLEDDGWLVSHDGWVRLTRPAYLVSNEIFQEFVSV